MKKNLRKLSLSRETLRTLSGARVGGDLQTLDPTLPTVEGPTLNQTMTDCPYHTDCDYTYSCPAVCGTLKACA